MNRRPVVVGGTGMAGSALVSLWNSQKVDHRATTRHVELARTLPHTEWVEFDGARDSVDDLVAGLGAGDTVVNCAALIKHHIDDTVIESRLAAIHANAVLPHELALAAERQGFRVINVTTDCVFSGDSGPSDENSKHDAKDVYGRSKSLGEVTSPHVLNLRTSIIGHEIREHRGLLAWVLGHDQGATLPGFVNHRWNGITTPTLARLLSGIVSTQNPVHGTVHLAPRDPLSKADLCAHILAAYGRDDVNVVSVEAPEAIDRSLASLRGDDHSRIWNDAGYAAVPTVAELVAALPRGHEEG